MKIRVRIIFENIMFIIPLKNIALVSQYLKKKIPDGIGVILTFRINYFILNVSVILDSE